MRISTKKSTPQPENVPHHPKQIDIKHIPRSIHFEIHQRSSPRRTRIIQQDVDPTFFLNDVVYDFLAGGEGGDI